MRRFRDYVDLAVLVVLAGLALASDTLWQGGSPQSVILGTLLALALPGYAIIAAAFPPGSHEAPGALERFALGLGAALAVLALGGLVLNVTPWGIRAPGWRVYLGAIILVALCVATWRRARSDQARAVATPRRDLLLGLRWQDAVLFGGATVVLGLALGLGGVGARERTNEGFTQFWAFRLGTSEQPVLDVGIRNLESVPMQYRLLVTAEGATLEAAPQIKLLAGETWHGHFALPSATSTQRIEARLYRFDAPAQVYRLVRVEPSSGA